MNDEQIRFHIPAEFIAERVQLTAAELVYGYRNGWLDDRGVVDLALAKYKNRHALLPQEEELALLLSDQLEKVPDLMAGLSVTSPPDGHGEVWLYLALAWLYEQRSQVEDALHVIDLLYADFDYAEQVEGLVSFMPARNRETGPDAIERRWREYIERKTEIYRTRTA